MAFIFIKVGKLIKIIEDKRGHNTRAEYIYIFSKQKGIGAASLVRRPARSTKGIWPLR